MAMIKYSIKSICIVFLFDYDKFCADYKRVKKNFKVFFKITVKRISLQSQNKGYSLLKMARSSRG